MFTMLSTILGSLRDPESMSAMPIHVEVMLPGHPQELIVPTPRSSLVQMCCGEVDKDYKKKPHQQPINSQDIIQRKAISDGIPLLSQESHTLNKNHHKIHDLKSSMKQQTDIKPKKEVGFSPTDKVQEYTSDREPATSHDTPDRHDYNGPYSFKAGGQWDFPAGVYQEIREAQNQPDIEGSRCQKLKEIRNKYMSQATNPPLSAFLFMQQRLRAATVEIVVSNGMKQYEQSNPKQALKQIREDTKNDPDLDDAGRKELLDLICRYDGYEPSVNQNIPSKPSKSGCTIF